MTNQQSITGLPDENTIAKRYTQALFAIAGEQGLEEEFLSQLTDIGAALAAEAGSLGELLITGRLPLARQKSLLQEVFGARIHPLLQNMLFLLLDKGRGGYLPALLSAYQQLLDDKAGILAVTAMCPQPMTAGQQASLTAAIAKLFGKQVRLHQEVDAGLIGGLKLIIGGTVYDGSLARQLEKLENHLISN
jgi:F-type H+-transporting ATPase subunit delta